jgi:hypothetical protein
MVKRASMFALLAMLVTVGIVGTLDAQPPIKRFTLLIEGQPPLQLKASDSDKVPSGTIHDARSGDKGAKVIATYVVEKGKPLATPAP